MVIAKQDRDKHLPQLQASLKGVLRRFNGAREAVQQGLHSKSGESAPGSGTDRGGDVRKGINSSTGTTQGTYGGAHPSWCGQRDAEGCGSGNSTTGGQFGGLPGGNRQTHAPNSNATRAKGSSAIGRGRSCSASPRTSRARRSCARRRRPNTSSSPRAAQVLWAVLRVAQLLGPVLLDHPQSDRFV